MGSPAKEPSDPVVLAASQLDAAIYALTDTLEYEWDGEFRKEIERLNMAHNCFRIAIRRSLLAQ